MSFNIGLIVGSVLGMGILCLLLSLFAFKSLEPWPRAVATVGTAYIIAVVVYGSQDGGQVVEALFNYGIGAAFMLWERYRHYRKHWVDDKPSDLEDIFR